MRRIWKDFVHPCMFQSYISSIRGLPGNVKAALCVSFPHLQAICELNCMPFFFTSSLQSLHACINSSKFRTTLACMPICCWMYVWFCNSEIRMIIWKVFSGVHTKTGDIHENTKIEVYCYRMAHRCASCSSETLCRDCGALMCNTVVKFSENDVEALE
jgi:hypothetical protein